jgi:hypothetical protein
MLTARDDGMEPVAGLEAGADDRVVRPGQARMLDGRIRASPRRIGGGRRLAGGERLDPRRPVGARQLRTQPRLGADQATSGLTVSAPVDPTSLSTMVDRMVVCADIHPAGSLTADCESSRSFPDFPDRMTRSVGCARAV